MVDPRAWMSSVATLSEISQAGAPAPAWCGSGSPGQMAGCWKKAEPALCHPQDRLRARFLSRTATRRPSARCDGIEHHRVLALLVRHETQNPWLAEGNAAAALGPWPGPQCSAEPCELLAKFGKGARPVPLALTTVPASPLLSKRVRQVPWSRSRLLDPLSHRALDELPTPRAPVAGHVCAR